MKKIKFVAYLFYRFYSTGKTYGIPYANTIAALSMLFFLNLFSVLISLKIPNLVPSFDKSHWITSYFKTALFVIPILCLFILLIRKKDLVKMHFEEDRIKRGNLYLIIYIVFSMAILSLLTFYGSPF